MGHYLLPRPLGPIILAVSTVDGENTVTHPRIDIILLPNHSYILPLKLSRPNRTTPLHSTRQTVRPMSNSDRACFGTLHPLPQPTDILVPALRYGWYWRLSRIQCVHCQQRSVSHLLLLFPGQHELPWQLKATVAREWCHCEVGVIGCIPIFSMSLSMMVSI